VRWGRQPPAAAGRRLAAMLRAGARDLYVDEAAVELVLRHGYWICREEFAGPFVHEQADPGLIGDQLVAGAGWRGAVEGLGRGELPCPASEFAALRIAASLGAGVPAGLRRALGGFGRVNIALVAGAVLDANGMVSGTVSVPAPPAYPPGIRVVAAGGTVVQEGGCGPARRRSARPAGSSSIRPADGPGRARAGPAPARSRSCTSGTPRCTSRSVRANPPGGRSPSMSCRHCPATPASG
jgi:hypothetical protein